MGFFSGFKKVVSKINPVKGLILGKDKKKTSYTKHDARVIKSEREKQLEAAMKEYDAIPGTIHAKYGDVAKQAGTYANTPEFMSGLQSEVDAGARGARVGMVGRINALRKELGMEDFNPDGYAETQAGANQQAIMNMPTPPPAVAETAEPIAAAPAAAPATQIKSTVPTVRRTAPDLKSGLSSFMSRLTSGRTSGRTSGLSKLLSNYRA